MFLFYSFLLQRVLKSMQGLLGKSRLEKRQYPNVTSSQFMSRQINFITTSAEVRIESHAFLERTQGDICGLNHRCTYKIIHLFLLLTRNLALAQITKLRAHSDYAIKTICFEKRKYLKPELDSLAKHEVIGPVL